MARVDGRTRRQKAEAVGLSVVAGTSEAARRTGVPESTIRYWRDSPEFAELRERKKEEVAADVWATFQSGVRRVGELIPQTDDALKVATATGILFDKFALMTGQATERHENREILHDFADGEKEALEQWLHDLAKERANAG
jgi:hypothetical protein